MRSRNKRGIFAKLADWLFGPRCEGPCERRCELHVVSSQTRYVWDGVGVDPNRSLNLCEECAVDYTEYMNDMWRDYWSGVL